MLRRVLRNVVLLAVPMSQIDSQPHHHLLERSSALGLVGLRNALLLLRLVMMMGWLLHLLLQMMLRLLHLLLRVNLGLMLRGIATMDLWS